MNSKKKEFVGQEPSTLENILNLRFLYPKRWRLMRFEVDQDVISILLGDGTTHSIRAGEFSAKIDIDKFERRKVTIELIKGQKFAFFESLMFYPDEDFEEIIRILGATDSGLAKFTKGVMKITKGMRSTKSRPAK